MQGVGDEDGEDAAKLRQDFSAILQEFGLKDKYLPELKPKQYGLIWRLLIWRERENIKNKDLKFGTFLWAATSAQQIR
jgi:hypothetical protein